MYYKDKRMKDVINQCIFNLKNEDDKEFNKNAVLKNICEAYKQIDPPAHNTSRKYQLVDYDKSLVGYMDTNPLVWYQT